MREAVTFGRPAVALAGIVAAAVLLGVGLLAQTRASVANEYRDAATRILREATSGDFAWQRLAELTDTFGHRLSGSSQLEQAIQWAAAEMAKDGLEAVRTEKVMVPHWVRGHESAEIVGPSHHQLVMLGLGNSVGTGPEGIEANVVIVRDFDELEAKAEMLKGKIVLYNVPFTSYGDTVQYRGNGASRAARHGAVAMLLRSVGLTGLRTPHTGALRYDDGMPQIPAAAISTEDAERMQRMADRGTTLRVRLQMDAQMLPDAESANVIGEIRGHQHPDEVIVVGGHLDSWDVGMGATDDGGGCVVTWEALRILKKLGLRPRRTIRVVLFTNEENGLRGGMAYRDRYRDQLTDHVLMLESDSGVFKPLGFGFTGSGEARTVITEIASFFRDWGADQISPGGGGADIGPSVQVGNVPAMSLEVDGSNYFLVHHTPADTMDRIEPADVARAAGMIAVMAYVVADMPERLPR